MSKIKTSFSGHDKFDCKVDWLVKGLKAFREDKSILSQSNIENGIALLGLGKNMIKSLNHWMKILGVIDGNNLTKLGEIILDKDPYLENSDTLWLLHWNLVKNREKATLYYLFFNKIYLNNFTKDDILERVNSWLNENEIKFSLTTINSDIDVFLKMYSNSSSSEVNMSIFADLNIFTKSKDRYILNINSRAKVSDEVFLYILSDYIDTLNTNSISIDNIQRGEVSIQKSLCMNENRLFSKINKLSKITNNSISYSEASGVRQIYISDKLDTLKLLNNIFK